MKKTSTEQLGLSLEDAKKFAWKTRRKQLERNPFPSYSRKCLFAEVDLHQLPA